MSKSVSCSNPWCSNRALCVYCKGDSASKAAAPGVFALKRSAPAGFARLDFTDRLGSSCSLEDNIHAGEPTVWFGDNRDRAHLTVPMVAALLPYLAAFVECGSIRNPTSENEQHPLANADTATTAPITVDQPKRLQDQPEPGRVVQSDPPTMHSTLLWTKTTGGAWESGPFTIIERIDGKGWNAGDGTGEAVLMGASLTDCVAACERRVQSDPSREHVLNLMIDAYRDRIVSGEMAAMGAALDIAIRQSVEFMRGADTEPTTLGNLLAVIHGDGGHRQADVGTEQAAREAEEIVMRPRLDLPKPGYVVSETYPGVHVQKIVLGYATVAEAMDAHSVLATHFYGHRMPQAGDPA